MTDLHTRLQTFFGASTARLLARAAPLTLLAGGIGTAIAAVIARPEFATSGWGVILGGMAVNLTSALVYDIVNTPSDDERARIVEQGIVRRDRDVLTLSAAALVDAGPELAQALPEASRRELIDGLEQGMRQAGGSLEQLAPRYAGALRAANPDWAALREELRWIVIVEQTIDIGEDALNQDSGQHVEQPDGPVKQTITIAPGGQNIGSSQVVIGSGGRARERDEPIDAATNSVPGNRQHERRLLRTKTRRLRELEAQAALYGPTTPPAITIEIEDLRGEIARLQEMVRAGRDS